MTKSLLDTFRDSRRLDSGGASGVSSRDDFRCDGTLAIATALRGNSLKIDYF